MIESASLRQGPSRSGHSQSGGGKPRRDRSQLNRVLFDSAPGAADIPRSQSPSSDRCRPRSTTTSVAFGLSFSAVCSASRLELHVLQEPMRQALGVIATARTRREVDCPLGEVRRLPAQANRRFAGCKTKTMPVGVDLREAGERLRRNGIRNDDAFEALASAGKRSRRYERRYCRSCLRHSYAVRSAAVTSPSEPEAVGRTSRRTAAPMCARCSLRSRRVR